MLENNRKFWEKSWEKHITNYVNFFPRTGIFIKNYFKNVKSILEIAGGSCRDCRYLARNGYKVVCTDFEKNVIFLLKKTFPNDKVIYSIQDAFFLSFKDNSFDLVFHNGFFVYFRNNEDIYKLLREQERIAKRYIVFFVHNQKNNELLKLFTEKSKVDSLYDIRFFSIDELLEIIKSSKIKYKSIKFKKFGGIGDIGYKAKIKGILPNILYPLREIVVPKLYQFQSWKHTEKICCIIELDKQKK